MNSNEGQPGAAEDPAGVLAGAAGLGDGGAAPGLPRPPPPPPALPHPVLRPPPAQQGIRVLT